MSRAQTVQRISDEMWEALKGNIDWRFENGGGVSFANLDAKTVLRWCNTMGWEIPPGTEAHARSDNG
jgi:hypothetical protein